MMTEPTDARVAHVLDGWTPPPLSADFTDRMMALVADGEAQGQALPPPVARRHRPGARWRLAPRLVAGAMAVGIMTATAAAAAGVFGDVGITIPAWQRTVESVVGVPLAKPRLAATPAPMASPPEVAATPATPPTLREMVADGRIDSREEFNRLAAAVDARRTQRQAQRRAMIEQRLQQRLEQRRAQGLPVPSDEQVAAARARITARLAERDAAAAASRQARREALGNRMDNGEAVSIESLRAERRGRLLERLTPEQRERLRQLRERRRGGATVPPSDSSEPPQEN